MLLSLINGSGPSAITTAPVQANAATLGVRVKAYYLNPGMLAPHGHNNVEAAVKAMQPVDSDQRIRVRGLRETRKGGWGSEALVCVCPKGREPTDSDPHFVVTLDGVQSVVKIESATIIPD